jgi:hypothetical protein
MQNGNQEALSMKAMFANNELHDIHHEAYDGFIVIV